MRLFTVMAVVFWFCPHGSLLAQVMFVRTAVEEMTEAIYRISGKAAAKEILEVGGESALKELTERAVREGGDDALQALVRLTDSNGISAVRAFKNSPDLLPVLNAMDNLPAEQAGVAFRRLGAGAEGRALANIVAEHGGRALQAEIRHPGLGGWIVRDLGEDGARMCQGISTDQAKLLARISNDLKGLPEPQRGQMLRVIGERSDAFFTWFGNFAQQNPGKVLFTASGTAVFLASQDQIFGGKGEMVLDANGNPVYVPKEGTFERIVLGAIRPISEAVAQWLVPLVGLLLLMGFGIWLWRRCHPKYGHPMVASACPGRQNNSMLSAKPTDSPSAEPTDSHSSNPNRRMPESKE